MEEVHSMQQSDAASVVKVAREPAIIINGLPDLPPDCPSDLQSEVKNTAEPQVDPRFGEWLEGRKVKKLFGDKYFVGKVVQYDGESNWYSVVYDDGDQEDLEWHELEEVLLPLEITIPLKTLVMDKCKLQDTVPDYRRPKVGRPRKVYAIMEGNTNRTSDTVLPGLLPVSTPNDATSGGLLMLTAGENTQLCLNANNQPRKRGRPRKNAAMPVPKQPKRRGRPPKNRSASGNSQSAGSTPSSLALVPVQDTSVATDAREAYWSQNSVCQRNTETARAEKLKRDNLRLQGLSR